MFDHHPEEPRSWAHLEGRPRALVAILRGAPQGGEHLRMTVASDIISSEFVSRYERLSEQRGRCSVFMFNRWNRLSCPRFLPPSPAPPRAPPDPASRPPLP